MEKISIWSLLVDGLCLAAVGIPILVIKYSVNPTQRGFYCSDSSLYYPYHSSTVPTGLNVTVRNRSTNPTSGTNSKFWQISDLISISSAVLNVDCLIVTEWRYC